MILLFVFLACAKSDSTDLTEFFPIPDSAQKVDSGLWEVKPSVDAFSSAIEKSKELNAWVVDSVLIEKSVPALPRAISWQKSGIWNLLSFSWEQGKIELKVIENMEESGVKILSWSPQNSGISFGCFDSGNGASIVVHTIPLALGWSWESSFVGPSKLKIDILEPTCSEGSEIVIISDDIIEVSKVLIGDKCETALFWNAGNNIICRP